MTHLPRAACTVLISALLIGSYAHAQKIRGLRTLSKTLTSHQLNRTVLNAAKRPDIRLSVARLDHAVLLDTPMNKRPHSTAFLFTTRYKPQGQASFDQGAPVVWAVTAGHTAQLGEKLRLTFYNGKKEIPVDGTLVQQGPALLSDAALIKLNTPLPAELHPFELVTEINPQEKLTTWGYASNKLYQINNLTFEKDNTRFLRTDFPVEQKKTFRFMRGPVVKPTRTSVRNSLRLFFR